MKADSDITTDVGNRLLFENERVRVWDLRLEPGESTGLHRHETDYFYVAIGGGSLQGVAEDGTPKSIREMADGEVVFREIDGQEVHEAINVGDSPWRNLVIELK